jgi:ABC-2 type transport system permease protein
VRVRWVGWPRLTSGLLTALLANLGVALLVAVGLAVPGLPWADSLGLGLGMAAVGCVFAAITALAAQLAGSMRPAIGIVTSVIALAYLLRAVGDAASPGSWAASLSWLSPIGWSQQLRPFGPLNWWVLGIPALFTIAVTAVAYVLAGRRDLGTGLLPARPGPPVAGASLGSPLGLAWRLQRGTLLAWTAGFAVYGLVIGGLATGIGPLVGNNAAARELFVKLGGQAGLVNALLAAMMGFMGGPPPSMPSRRRCGCAARSPASGPSRCSPPPWAGSGGRGAIWCSRWPGRSYCSCWSA